MINYEPIGDRILIKADPKKTTSGGLVLTEANFRQDPWGEVVLVGDGVPLTNIKLDIKFEGTISTDNLKQFDEVLARIERIMEMQLKGREIKVKPGQRVHYGKHAGTEVTIEEQKYIMIREVDVFGRIPAVNTGEHDY